jgi:hypothetical protein
MLADNVNLGGGSVLTFLIIALVIIALIYLIRRF